MKAKSAALKAAIAIFASFVVNHAVAEPSVLHCGESKGYIYVLQGGLVPPDMAGWHEDGITGGSIRLIMDGTNNEWDVQWTDRIGEHSAVAEGGIVNSTSRTAETLTVVVRHSGGAFTTYLFDLVNQKVVWTESRDDGRIKSVKIMVAECLRFVRGD